MLVIMPSGTYLVDRKLATRRVQMRWPTVAVPGKQQKSPVGPPHSLVRAQGEWIHKFKEELCTFAVNNSNVSLPYRFGGEYSYRPTYPNLCTPQTILDGEMVVDDDLLSDKKARRFLAYDLMALNGRSVVHQPWKVRECWMGGLRRILAKEGARMSHSQSRPPLTPPGTVRSDQALCDGPKKVGTAPDRHQAVVLSVPVRQGTRAECRSNYGGRGIIVGASRLAIWPCNNPTLS